jgi:hypothetical protein
MWETISGVILAIVWIVALLVMIAGAYDLCHAFSTKDVSAIQQTAGGVLGVGEAIIAYVIAKAIDRLLIASKN